jgi:hypothetical protein
MLPYLYLNGVPEIQGTTQEVAIAKCRQAAELVVNQDPDNPALIAPILVSSEAPA